MGEVLGIRELRLQNFRCFDEEAVTLHPSVTVFVADNGAGKSTVLDALGIVLAKLIEPLVPSSKEPRRGMTLLASDARAGEIVPPYSSSTYPVRVSALGTIAAPGMFGPEDAAWSVELLAASERASATDHAGVSHRLKSIAATRGLGVQDLPVIAHYGTSRSTSEVRQSKRPTLGRIDRRFGYRNGLDSTANYSELTEWLAQTEWERTASRGSEWESVLLAVYSVASRMLEPHGVVGVRYSLEQRDLIAEFGEPGSSGEPATVHTIVPMSLMADGFRSTLALVADIAFRCGALNHHLEAEAAELTEGVILIDEIDMHLHPKWQARVVTDLVAAFPRMQFVMTTHSPLVVSSLDASQVRVIRHDRGRSTVEAFAGRTLGADVEYLTEAVFQGPTRAETEYSRALADLGQTLGHGDLDAAGPIAVRLRELLGIGSDFDAERLLREFDWRVRRRQETAEAERESNRPSP
jgi:energy-coupling factor transporter ATP-binding protein EcfA2